MTPEARIKELESKLAATKQAATHMMVGMAMGIASTPEGRELLADGFAEAAKDPNPTIAEMAKAVSDAIKAALLVDND